jgi:Holliday junction resolvase RusA-like endonuclease
MIELVIEGPPTVWKAPYVGTRGAFSPKHHVKNIYRDILRAAYKGHLITDPVRCDCYFYMPIPKSASKKMRQKMIDGEIRPTAGGDLTNLRKFIEDCLQEIVIDNDRQIVEGDTEKWFSDNPRSVLQIFPCK